MLEYLAKSITGNDKGFKSASQICKNLNDNVINYLNVIIIAILFLSNLYYNNINNELFLYNDFYNKYNQYCLNNLFYKYYSLKKFNCPYKEYNNLLYN